MSKLIGAAPHARGLSQFDDSCRDCDDFEPGVKEWRRACAARSWYWTREQQADLLGELPGPFEPIERDLGPAVAAV